MIQFIRRIIDMWATKHIPWWRHRRAQRLLLWFNLEIERKGGGLCYEFGRAPNFTHPISIAELAEDHKKNLALFEDRINAVTDFYLFLVACKKVTITVPVAFGVARTTYKVTGAMLAFAFYLQKMLTEYLLTLRLHGNDPELIEVAAEKVAMIIDPDAWRKHGHDVPPAVITQDHQLRAYLTHMASKKR